MISFFSWLHHIPDPIVLFSFINHLWYLQCFYLLFVTMDATVGRPAVDRCGHDTHACLFSFLHSADKKTKDLVCCPNPEVHQIGRVAKQQLSCQTLRRTVTYKAIECGYRTPCLTSVTSGGMLAYPACVLSDWCWVLFGPVPVFGGQSETQA